MDRAARAALGSALVGAIALGLKFTAYALTGSVALYSDAIETVVNVLASLAAFVALVIAARPADARHPYGHAKAEYVSAVIEGALIAAAALAIFHQAYEALRQPTPLATPLVGLAFNGVATALNAVWCRLLFRLGRALRSPALLADAKHLSADVVTSAGVFVGFALVALTHVGWLDPAIGIVVGLNILREGWGLVSASTEALVDRAVPTEIRDQIVAALAKEAGGTIEIHDLRTRLAGRNVFADVHVVVDGTMSVNAAHAIAERMESEVRRVVPGASVVVHIEPESEASGSRTIVVS